MEEYLETKGNQRSPTAVLLNLTLVVVSMVASSAVLIGGIYVAREGYKFLLFEFCGTHGEFGSKYLTEVSWMGRPNKQTNPSEPRRNSTPGEVRISAE